MALISHKLKLIYSHVPKTAGASFKQSILNVDDNAESYGSYHSAINDELIKKYPDYIRTTIVRNSYQILVSYYIFICVRYKKIKPNTTWSFKECLLKHAKNSSIINQLRYIKRNDVLYTNYIIDYNNIENDLNVLNEKLNTNLVMSSKYHYYGDYDYKDYYNDELKEIAYNLCKDDIEYFNWEF